METLKDGAIGFVEDHAEAGHADPETSRRRRIDGVHQDILPQTLTLAIPERIVTIAARWRRVETSL